MADCFYYLIIELLIPVVSANPLCEVTCDLYIFTHYSHLLCTCGFYIFTRYSHPVLYMRSLYIYTLFTPCSVYAVFIYLPIIHILFCTCGLYIFTHYSHSALYMRSLYIYPLFTPCSYAVFIDSPIIHILLCICGLNNYLYPLFRGYPSPV